MNLPSQMLKKGGYFIPLYRKSAANMDVHSCHVG